MKPYFGDLLKFIDYYINNFRHHNGIYFWHDDGAIVEQDLENCGEIHEYYDPESGEPIRNPGFQNWNLLNINMKAWLKGEPVVEEF